MTTTRVIVATYSRLLSSWDVDTAEAGLSYRPKSCTHQIWIWVKHDTPVYDVLEYACLIRHACAGVALRFVSFTTGLGILTKWNTKNCRIKFELNWTIAKQHTYLQANPTRQKNSCDLRLIAPCRIKTLSLFVSTYGATWPACNRSRNHKKQSNNQRAVRKGSIDLWRYCK